MDTLKLSEVIVQELCARFADPAVRGLIEATEKAAEDNGTFEVVITTEDIDRMGEIIKADGWDMTHYLKNPVVLWGHSHRDLPIGVCTSLEKVGTTWVAKGKFCPEEANPLGQYVRRLYDLGIVRATSVGFIPHQQDGNIITKAELLEFSFVSVPANAMCLSTLIKSGISVNEMATKGLITLKEEEKPPEPPAPDEQKSFQDQVLAGLNEIKSLFSALEASLKQAEPERKEDETTGDETPEAKAFRLFSEGRSLMQLAAGALSESLAEARKAVEAKTR